jgi:hypothetical protein
MCGYEKYDSNRVERMSDFRKGAAVYLVAAKKHSGDEE